jgi:hypothetical protein
MLLLALGGDPNDRHTDLYRRKVRPLEYRCLLEAVYDNLDCGISAVAAAPFLLEVAERSWLERLTNRCSARRIQPIVIWIDCDLDSMRDYLEQRDAGRDTWKLSNWDAYSEMVDPGLRPSSAHLVVNNGRGAAINLADRIRERLGVVPP